MGRLAELAKATALKGAVTVTDENGASMTYPDEAAAERACAGKKLTHRRGAFFVTADEAATRKAKK